MYRTNQIQTHIDQSQSASKVNLLIGPYRSGKTLKLAQSILDCCYGKPFTNAIVIVPSKRYLSLFNQRLLQVFGKRCLSDTAYGALGLIGLKIVSFYDACKLILRQAGVSVKIVPERIRVALIERVLRRLNKNGELTLLGSIAEFAGAHVAIIDLIDEFQRSGLSPYDVLSRLRQTASIGSRYMELAKVYQEYWRELDDLGYVDQRRLAFKAREALSKGINLSFDLIAVDGFDRFNQLQLKVLHGLSKHTKKMTICFDYVSPDNDLENEYAWKEAGFRELQRTFHEKIELREVQEGSEPIKQAPEIETYRTIDRFFEMDEIARRVKSAAVRSETPLDQILVVARNLKAYRGAVEAAFEQAGINYVIDEPIQLTSLPVVHSLICLLKLPVKDFARSDVIYCLRSPYFNLGRIGLTSNDVEWLDSWSLNTRVVSGIEQWSETGASETDSKGKIPPATQTKLINFLRRLQIELTDGMSLVDYVSWTEDLIDELLTLPDKEEHAGPFEHWQEQKAFTEFKKTLAAFVQEEYVIRHTDSFNSMHNGLTYENYIKKLEQALSKANFRSIPRAHASVTICGADLAPNRNFDEVFIAGMIEGEFPRRAGRSGFTSQDEVARWASFEIDIQNPRFNPSFEKALFSSLIKRARKVVHVSYPSYDLTGEELVPSFLLKNIQPQAVEPQLALPFMRSRSEPLSVRDALAGHFWFTGCTQPFPNWMGSRPDCSYVVGILEEPLTAARGRILGKINTLYNGSLIDSVAAGVVDVRLPEYWSASHLSSYGRCPFQYWISHVLETEPHEEPKNGITPKILGETCHLALELFYKEMNANNLRLGFGDRTEAERIYNAAIEEALERLENRSDLRKGEFWQYEKKEIVYKLKRFFERELERALNDTEAFVPSLIEVGFGFNENPPLAIICSEEHEEQILIRGRIDRVDISQQPSDKGGKLVRVIDYKTGTTAISAEDTLAGRNLQLPLYALAIERSIIPGSEVVSGQYISISSGEPVGRLSLGRLEKLQGGGLLEHTQSQVRNFVQAIKQGDFSVKPSNGKVCLKCPHETICRIKELDPDKRAGEEEFQS